MGTSYRWKSVVWKWWNFYIIPDGPSNNERCPTYNDYVSVPLSILLSNFIESRFSILWCLFSAVTEKHTVKYNGREVRYLNELEYIDKEVWANVWQVFQLFLMFSSFHCDNASESIIATQNLTQILLILQNCDKRPANINMWNQIGAVSFIHFLSLR